MQRRGLPSAIENERKAAAAAKDPVAGLTPDEKELIGVNPAPDAAAKVPRSLACPLSLLLAPAAPRLAPIVVEDC
jgi:hypothetical protein